ncbi:MAG: ImmA/IrrE family metallo-endopeptidase [Lewinellaceae bacterium]|nr:ImmA/IrrE family metallo-endopeptidase [Phaeodactylibacter sp.]MCB9037194.1 ImmA/IrrE family metallo-endopeptidase [Lewinellaceae bacterium]
MTKALITGGILTWARERAGIAVDSLSASVGVKPEVIVDWESGKKYPTFNQAQTLAKKLLIPFGYLFLSEPPTEVPQITDLRTVRNEERNKFSLEFQDVLNDALRKQNWYREQILLEGAQPLSFIGRFSINDRVEDVARNIQDTLGIDQGFRNSCISWEDFLTKFIERAESRGVLVLRNGVVRNNNRRKLSVQEFRGFVLSDQIAPLIFINNNDAQAAKIFTLAHELAHLWIGESGVSNIDPGRKADTPISSIEKFCNQVAAEVLVPAKDFLASWDDQVSHQENVNNLCRVFRVSALVVLIRAKSLNKISSRLFYEEYSKKLSGQKRKAQPSGGDFRNTLPVRNSKTLTRAIISSALEGTTLYRDAARLLGVKVSTLNSLASHLEIR